jgi:Mg-chelatase subunit ChlD
MQIEEDGPTALGPALTTAIAMAAEGAPGSMVVLCTDGLANVGLGAFDEIKNEDQMKHTDEFYERLGELAKNKGVTVSIISIEGDECNIDTLSKISEITGGSVERVNPTGLTQNFSNIL